MIKKTLSQKGFSLLEIMVAAGGMTFLGLVAIQFTKVAETVKTDINVRTEHMTEEAYVRSIIFDDLSNAGPSINNIAETFWIYKKDGTSKKELKKCIYNKLSPNDTVDQSCTKADLSFQFYRKLENANIGSLLIEPNHFYETQGTVVKKLNYTKLRALLKTKKKKDGSQAQMSHVFLHFRSPAVVEGNPYAILGYFDGKKFTQVEGSSAPDYSTCTGHTAFPDFLDKFFRCMPDAGGTTFVHVDPIKPIKYTFDVITDKSKEKQVGKFFNFSRFTGRKIIGAKVDYGESTQTDKEKQKRENKKFRISDRIEYFKLSRKDESTIQVGVDVKVRGVLR